MFFYVIFLDCNKLVYTFTIANFMTAKEAINEFEDGLDLSDLSDEEDSLFDTDIQ